MYIYTINVKGYMYVASIHFKYDHSKRCFASLGLKFIIDLHSELSIEQKKDVIYNDFSKLETYFNSLLDSHYIVKKAIGSEFTTYLHAGYSYSLKSSLRVPLDIEVSYQFAFKNGDIDEPEIDLFIVTPSPVNIYIVIDILKTFDLIISQYAYSSLRRIYEKLVNDFSIDTTPSHILNRINIPDTSLRPLNYLMADSEQLLEKFNTNFLLPKAKIKKQILQISYKRVLRQIQNILPIALIHFIVILIVLLIVIFIRTQGYP